MRTQLNILTMIIPVFFLTIGCGPVKNMKTNARSNPQANFQAYKSYKFVDELTYSEVNDNHSTENRRAIENAVHKHLKRKGLAEAERPDLLINFFVIDTEESKTITRTTQRSRKYGGLTHTDTYLRNYERGTLIVDLVDMRKNELVWSGMATGVISGKQKDMNRTIRKAVKATLSKYPPKSK